MSKKIVILNKLLQDIKQNIPNKDQLNTSISKSTVGWQLDHTLKVINGVCSILAKTNPKDYKKDFNMMRNVLFPLCYIPRGRAKAPKVVRPPEIITTEDLQIQLETAKSHVGNLNNIHDNAYFKHHIFGSLDKANTLRFLQMHTKHHLKIVNDILKAS